MTGKTHLLAGFGVFWFLTIYGVDPHLPAIAAGAFVGCLLPDIDHPRSTISRTVLAPAGVVLRLFACHRGMMHSFAAMSMIGFWSMALLGAAGAPEQLSGFWLFGFLFGYLSHLLLDALTPSGVPVLWPITSTRMSLPLVRTGTRSESVFVVILAVWIASMLVVNLVQGGTI